MALAVSSMHTVGLLHFLWMFLGGLGGAVLLVSTKRMTAGLRGTANSAEGISDTSSRSMADAVGHVPGILKRYAKRAESRFIRR